MTEAEIKHYLAEQAQGSWEELKAFEEEFLLHHAGGEMMRSHKWQKLHTRWNTLDGLFVELYDEDPDEVLRKERA